MSSSSSKMKVMTAGGAGSGGMKRTTTTSPVLGGTPPSRNNKESSSSSLFPAFATKKVEKQLPGPFGGLEIENHTPPDNDGVEEIPLHDDLLDRNNNTNDNPHQRLGRTAPPVPYSDDTSFAARNNNNNKSLSPTATPGDATTANHHYPPANTTTTTTSTTTAAQKSHHDLFWLMACFVGIMLSFVGYGLLLEYTTSGGRKLHELSFLFVTSALYTVTAAVGRYVRDETTSTIPPAQFALLGLTSMGSTFCSVRSLRYVIFPIQVLAKSCKPVPVMLMGAVMGKKYSLRKYLNVVLIVLGVALFMGGGAKKKTSDDGNSSSASGQLFGLLLLFISLCFDGGTGAYEDKLMSVYSVEPFDLMYQIQLAKTILAGVGLLVFNQLHIFMQMVQDMGFLLVALGLTGAIGQVFIFVTIAKFGALTCSIIGLARKVTTLVASIYFYGHSLNTIQFLGLTTSVAAMVFDFCGKSKKGGGGHHGGPPPPNKQPPEGASSDETEKMLKRNDDGGDVELAVGQKF